jgi:4-hydroxy-tetrahydrodipicolinate synthase
MIESHHILGVVTAVLTPIDRKGLPDLGRLQNHIRVLEADGSDAILIMGTTGEGPSFSVAERKVVLEAAIQAAGKMEVIAQTGCASLVDTIDLTRHAFSSGLKKVTIMPPFFFKDVSDDGLFEFYRRLIDNGLPPAGKLMLYHIPQVTQAPISFALVDRLLYAYGERIGGIKDSDGDLDHLKELCRRFPQISVLTGNDHLILDALNAGAAGCVTGVVNGFASLAAGITRSFFSGNGNAGGSQEQLIQVWKVLRQYQPYPTLLKALAALRYQDAGWLRVRPPLDPMPLDQLERMVGELRQIELPDAYSWIHQPALISASLERKKP